MLNLAREGRGACRPLAADDYSLPEDFFVIDPDRGISLNAGQQAAVRHVLSSPDRVMAVRGGAGTGKSTLIGKVQSALADNGHAMMAFAPTAGASRGVLREKGFAGADTVARLLVDERLQNDIQGKVVLVDEAGLLSTKDMKRLLELTTERNARLLLVGDYKQHSAVERGDAFRVLESLAGVKMAQVVDIQRQKGNYKQAVEAISRGDVEEGWRHLESLGSIKEIADHEQRETALVEDYLQTVRRGQTALVVSPTHREGERVTEKIRSGLRDDGRLGKADRRVLRLKNLHLTDAQKQDEAHYQVGDVVQFQQNVTGFQRGFRTEVVGMEEGLVLIANQTGRAVALPLERAKHFAVFQQQEMPLAKGDVVRVTQNGTTADGKHRINNGSLYRIAGFTRDGQLRLGNGWLVDKEFGHLTHGYVTTSHASQGKDVDRVLIAQSSLSWPASSQQQWYVSVSRGKKSVAVYTDDKEELARATSRSGERIAATELKLDLGDKRWDRLKDWWYRTVDRSREAAERVAKTLPEPVRAKGMQRG